MRRAAAGAPDPPAAPTMICTLCKRQVVDEEASWTGRDGTVLYHKHCRNAKRAWDNEVIRGSREIEPGIVVLCAG